MNIKTIATNLRNYISSEKADELLSTSGTRENREPQKRLLLVLSEASERNTPGRIADNLEAFSLDQDSWMIESLNPLVLLSAEYGSGSAETIRTLAGKCQKHGLRFIAAVGMVEYGLIGSGIRMSYGTVSPLWIELIKAMSALPVSHSWVTSELNFDAKLTSGDVECEVSGNLYFGWPN